MAKIPLRAYNREIENYIEQGRTEEAIAHGRHVLKFYSKNLDTYRLLGKAYLESQRYGEAADILQRVLSAVPDDFISQIGMSIIREDEGNLDAAIYHMERAHEIQPSNMAIQEELRRLYGHRDGVEPPKVRLTRGALVRLYARGDLYPQAIAEIRAALAENPNRVDLEVILARMNYLTGQKVEAAEVCSRLVSKLPYCFEANRILAEVLPGTSRAEDARIYQQRVYALDPYLEYISPSTPVTTDVPDHAVVIEHLEYDAETAEAQAPGWAQSLGVDWIESEGQLPDWMTEKEPKAAPGETVDETVEAPEPEQPSPEEPEIPDFMATAGWMVSDGEEQPPQEISDAETVGEDEITPAEIPDWLRSMAPELEAETTEDDEQTARWLESILPAGTADDEQMEISDLALPDDLNSIEGLFDEDSTASMEHTGQPADADGLSTPVTLPDDLVSKIESDEQIEKIDTGELPDWLTGIEIDDRSNGAEPVEAAETEWIAQVESPADESTEGESDWLARLAAGETTLDEFKPEDAEASTVEMPDWLREASEASDRESQERTDSTSLVDEVSADQLKAFEAAASSEAPETETDSELPPLEDLDATMAWLENLAAHQGADEDTLTTQPDERTETTPDWIASLQFEDESAGGEDEEPVTEKPAVQAWESELDADADADQASAESIPESAPEALAGDSDEEALPALGEMELEDSFAWLEGLAARQGAEDGTLLTEAEDRPKAVPGWIAEISEPKESESPVSAAEDEETIEETPEDLPSWLTEALSDEIAEPEKPVAEELAWVPEIELQTVAEAEVSAEPSVEESNVVAEAASADAWQAAEEAEIETPQNLEEEPVEAVSTESPVLQTTDAEEEIPEWLQELVDEDLAVELTEAKALDELPEWLEKLDQPKPADEAAEEAVAEPEPEITATTADTSSDDEVVVVERASTGDWASVLEEAQADLSKEQIDSALQRYTALIQSGNYLDETVHDLREALYRYPVDVSLWQLLGDAYAQNNMLQDALDAYTKAEELLR